ncbi:MAG: hypothetical protein ACREKI_04165 [Gemmatimonadota bacterium]
MMKPAESRGFALPAVIAGLLLLGALATAGLLVAAQVARIGRAARDGVHALYAAEAGLANARACWPASAVATLGPGDALHQEPLTLANGDVALVRIERIDDASEPALARFLVHAYGRPRRTPTAGRHLVFGLSLRSPDTLSAGPPAPPPPPRYEPCNAGEESAEPGVLLTPLPERPWLELYW